MSLFCLPFIEAIRQLRLDKHNRCVFVHVTYVPYIAVANELKTKPTQHSVKTLLSLGIQPDTIICRSEKPLPEDLKKKLALFTNVAEDAVISAPDLKTVYEIPLLFYQQNFYKILDDCLKLPSIEPNLTTWRTCVASIKKIALLQDVRSVRIALVGKYVDYKDAYKSIVEALGHAQIPHNNRVTIEWIDAEVLTNSNVHDYLQVADGILVPGGFGDRGVGGKLEAIRYARERTIPFFGICLGMQLAAIEFARNVLGLKQADSTEFNKNTPEPVIDLMSEQKNTSHMGGTLRVGSFPCAVTQASLAYSIYKHDVISERHRHRYELNMRFVPRLETQGFKVTGYYQALNLPEIIEIPEHPFFIACQFHPEFKSKPCAPHPLFVAFIKAAAHVHKN